ncbi:HGL134Cp [Eremothecium sinecaudum]|uniref:Phospholipid-transporting ATPase n=1 Tax=Eremothecium sinecaudum TaxID=45286 RepID=A0A0X8HVD5_9SACH|nr:HGL134Cp [Eremothecium sinecaudum]AMD22206.1 HGL134Cp [Eremothecium sinecaudum]
MLYSGDGSEKLYIVNNFTPAGENLDVVMNENGARDEDFREGVERDVSKDDDRINTPFDDRFVIENPEVDTKMEEDGQHVVVLDPPSELKPSIFRNNKSGKRPGNLKLAFAPDIHHDAGKSEFSYEAESTQSSATTPSIYVSKRNASHEAHERLHSRGPQDEEIHSPHEVKVLRWGTQRHKKPGMRAFGRGRSLRWARRNDDPFKPPQGEIETKPQDETDRSAEGRSVYYNVPLPDELLDEHGLPIAQFARNKIRTTKYTPLSFFPKNLLIQFKNAANVYFLIMVVLGTLPSFGVANPVLNAIPLIAIIIITAIKDAIEDSRRTVLDMEVNNTKTHIFTGIKNPNVSTDNVSLWRRFKKLNTRIMFKLIRFIQETFTKSGKRRRAQRKREEHHIALRSQLNAPRSSLDSVGQGRPSLDTSNLELSGTLVTQEGILNRNNEPIPDCKFMRSQWKHVRVGDIVRVHNNDEVPADMILLSTSDSDGACYIETKNLDGETNLKVRQSLSCSHKVRNSRDISRCKFWVESEGPQPNLYTYRGNVRWVDSDNITRNEPANINNVLLRGCFLRNTRWAVGIVIFTGKDTKIMLNAGITPTKKSRISKELNYSVMLNFVLIIVLCFIAALVNSIYYRSRNRSRDSFEFGTIGGSPTFNGLLSFFVALILYQSLVPISLYISIEIIKTAQAAFIYGDVLMYNERLDYPCTPKTWNISDDLGQIEYIFSDKTGTLTQNVMEFKKCTINGISYGRAYTEALAGLRKRQGIDVVEESAREKEAIARDKETMIELLQKLGQNSQFDPEETTLVSKELVEDLSGKSGNAQKEANEHFLMSLALCHSVLVEPNPQNPDKMDLKAQSPDEGALVSAARHMGFAFIGRSKQGVIVEVQGEQKEFQVLNVIEFNSARKRMSCIIKIPGEKPGEYKALLICKGADSVIFSRLDKHKNDNKLIERTALHLEEYATEGLRTLCIAQKELSWEEYKQWAEKYDVASSSLVNREEEIEKVADSLERDLILLGGTAIEDRLQDGVPASIAILAEAGIKLWVLTGDKVETAINIGFSCNLLTNDMELLVIKNSGDDVEHLGESTEEVVTALLDRYLKEKFNLDGTIEELEQEKLIHRPAEGEYGVVIDGDALKVSLSTEELQRKFLLLCKNCKTVLCCRVSPAQKAAVVKLIKDTLDVMTLAIGDGSNDVAMIQAANVGVGIAGEEGRQAVMSADYGIGQFRYLTRLILVHGRWSYKRLAEMIPQFFYKNIIFTVAHFWFGIFNNYDGSYLFEFTYLIFYNLAFTSLPVILLGIIDQDVSDKVSVAVPGLYQVGISRSAWTQKKFWFYCLDGIYQSVICFFFPYLAFYRTGLVTDNGRPLDHRYMFGVFVTCISVITCNLYVLLQQYRWDWFSTLFLFLSCLLVFVWTMVWSSSYLSREFYHAGYHIFSQPVLWVVLFAGILFCLWPRFTYDVFRKLFAPRDIDIIRECCRRGDFDMYPEDYDPTDPNRPLVAKERSGSISQEYYSEHPQSLNSLDKNTSSMPVLTTKPLSKPDYPSPEAIRAARTANPSLHPPRSSLDVTRQEMLQNNQLDSRFSQDRARTSLDLPGVTRATTLISGQGRA